MKTHAVCSYCQTPMAGEPTHCPSCGAPTTHAASQAAEPKACAAVSIPSAQQNGANFEDTIKMTAPYVIGLMILLTPQIVIGPMGLKHPLLEVMASWDFIGATTIAIPEIPGAAIPGVVVTAMVYAKAMAIASLGFKIYDQLSYPV